MTIGQQIKTARKKCGLTQTQLAEKLGVFQQEVQRWEQDKQEPKLCTAIKIQNILNIVLK